MKVLLKKPKILFHFYENICLVEFKLIQCNA